MAASGLRTRQDYLESLRRMRPNVHKFGERIVDVTTHPATRGTIESHARAFDAANGSVPGAVDLFTTESGSLSESRIMRHNSLIESMEDLIASMRLKREMFHRTGTCSGGLCVGWNGMNSLWAMTHELMEGGNGGGEYHAHLRTWVTKAQANGWIVAGALTDAKGNRSLSPSKQGDPDLYLRRVSQRPDGMVVRGAKTMICGVAASDEILVVPGSGLVAGEEDYAIAFAVPRDVEGLTIVETRRPSDTREAEDGFDIPSDTGITQAYLLFEDVFVPTERIFLCGETAMAARLIDLFTTNYRACIGACVAGQGDVMVGVASALARANGLTTKAFADKLVQMSIHNETTYGLGVGSIALGGRHPSGVWFADPLTANVNKIHVATLPPETRRLCQEIGGGIVETGCLPSSRDLEDPAYGPLLRKYMDTGVGTPEARARAARLAEWLTIGAGVPGCMHGGGSPQAAKLVVRSRTKIQEYEAWALRLAGVESPGQG